MGTAFITSLVGLSLGSLLAFINILLGTGALKSRLFACLEDYLDNVYKPTIEGHSRLDRLLEKLADRQEEFLRSFEENISKTLQKAILDAGAFLQTENKKIFDHAEISCNKFAIAVQKIDSSANLFKEVSESLNTQNQTLTESLSDFKSGIRSFKITGDKLEKNNVFQSLEKILVDLSTTQSSFASSAAVMENSLSSILDGNQQATQLAQSIYLSWANSTSDMLEAAGKIASGAQAFDLSTTSLTHQTESLSQIVPQFCAGINDFTAASAAIKGNNIIKDLISVVSDLQSTQQSFTDSTKILQTGLTTIIDANQAATQLAQEVYHGWQDYTLKAANATEAIATGALAFQQSALSAQEQSQAFGELIPQFKIGVNDFVKAATKVQKNNIIQELDKVIVNLSSTQDSFAKSSQILAAGVEGIIASNQQANQVASRVGQNLLESTDKIHASANALVSAAHSVENNSLAVDLNTIVGDWRTIQSKFSTATTSLSQTYTTVEPVISRIEPIADSIFVLVNEAREFSKEVVTLNQATLKSIESEAANRKQFSHDIHEFMRTSNSMDREMLKRLLTAIENLNSAIKPTILTPRNSSHN
jgi:predicted transcriptional regulator